MDPQIPSFGGITPVQFTGQPVETSTPSPVQRPPSAAVDPPSPNESFVELADLLDLAIEKGASDIHLGEDARIGMRINGRMVFVDGVGKLSRKQAEHIIFALLEPEERNQFLKMKELDASYEHVDGTMFRINVFFRRKRISAVLRLIPRAIRTIDELGLPQIVYKFVNAHQGLVLITGPTGSGKSTTMASMLEYMNQNQVRHIVTIEDPIEFIYEAKKCVFSQRELHTDTLSFRYALKSALRQDPDVVCLSEMRDAETITAAMTIAETGHLVFGTLHTSGAPQTVSRIVSAFPPVQQESVQHRLADSLLGVISQRLVPKIGGGRIAVFETLYNTPAVPNTIRVGDSHMLVNAIQTGQNQGMISMERSIYSLIERGLVDPRDVRGMLPD